ncbi:MAG: glycosyltransferase [Steroidobacteraceae bacterium]
MKTELSAVVPVFNEGPGVAGFLEALAEALARNSSSWEIIVVDDGSRDGSVEAVRAVAARCHVRLLRFSRNFGKESALSAGLDAARGDAAIMIDADFQHPLATIDEFVRHWRAGAHMVYGVRGDRATSIRCCVASPPRRSTGWLNGSADESESGAGDFRLLDRRVIEAIKSLPERRRFMKGLYSWVGFETARVVYDVQPRALWETMAGSFAASRCRGSSPSREAAAPAGLFRPWRSRCRCRRLRRWIVFESLVRGNPCPPSTIVTAACSRRPEPHGPEPHRSLCTGELFLEAKGRPAYLIMSDEDQARRGCAAARPVARVPRRMPPRALESAARQRAQRVSLAATRRAPDVACVDDFGTSPAVNQAVRSLRAASSARRPPPTRYRDAAELRAACASAAGGTGN